MRYLILLTLVSCASHTKPVDSQKLSELDCETPKNTRYLTKYDALLCLSNKIDKPLHKVSLSYKDLPSTGPIADLTFYAITEGYLNAKSISEFGSQDYLTQKEFNQFLSVYKKRQ